MTEVFAKCVLRETKSVYLKIYQTFRIPIAIVTYVVTLSCIAFGLTFALQGVGVWIDANRVSIANWMKMYLVGPVDYITTSIVGFIVSIPLWVILVSAFLFVVVGIPVGYAILKCLNIRKERMRSTKKIEGVSRMRI